MYHSSDKETEDMIHASKVRTVFFGFIPAIPSGELSVLLANSQVNSQYAHLRPNPVKSRDCIMYPSFITLVTDAILYYL